VLVGGRGAWRRNPDAGLARLDSRACEFSIRRLNQAAQLIVESSPDEYGVKNGISWFAWFRIAANKAKARAIFYAIARLYNFFVYV
jgi:hypothetical protein